MCTERNGKRPRLFLLFVLRPASIIQPHVTLAPAGPFDRYFDRAPRTVKEYQEKVEYIHLNPVKRALVTKPEEWRWSSIHDYKGILGPSAGTKSVLPVDRVLLPADARARI